MGQAEYDAWMRAKRRNVLPAAGVGAFAGAVDGFIYAAWDGFHVDWRDVVWHAGLMAVFAALWVFVRGLDDEEADEAAAPPRRTRGDTLFVVTAYLVFAGTGAWALTGDDLPNVAIFALAYSGLLVVLDLLGHVRSRRRERDAPGL